MEASPPDGTELTRSARLRRASAARGVPLPTILVTVAVLAVTYLAAKLAYRLRDVLLLIVVAGFIALILNPFVVLVQRRSGAAARPWPSSRSGRSWSSRAWPSRSAIRWPTA